MKRSLLLTILIVLTTTLLLAGCSTSENIQGDGNTEEAVNKYSADNPLVIRLGNVNSPTDSSVRAMEQWGEILAERSEGRIKMEIYSSGQLGGNREGVLALQEGSVEMWYFTPLSVAGFDPRFQLSGLPGLFSDAETAEKFYRDGWVGELMDKYALENGLRRIAVGEPSFGYLFANDKAGFAPSLDQLKGRKFRIVESPVMKEYFEKVGVIPTPMPWGEIYTGLQRGIIDGMFGNLVWPVAAGFHEVGNRITMLPYFYFPSDWFFSEKLWEQIPDDLKGIITESVKEFEDIARTEFAKETEVNIKKMKEQGVKFYQPTPEEIDKFRKQSFAIWKDYAIDVWGEEVVDRLETEIIKANN